MHMTADGGKTWTVISPDLTTNDKSKQQSPAGIGPDGQDVPCTLIAIAESPIERGVIWTGSNDGVVSMTRDGGKHWSNVTANIPNLPTCGSPSASTSSSRGRRMHLRYGNQRLQRASQPSLTHPRSRATTRHMARRSVCSSAVQGRSRNGTLLGASVECREQSPRRTPLSYYLRAPAPGPVRLTDS